MKNKFVFALIIFVIWILITLLGPKIQLGAEEMSLNALVTGGIAFWFVGDVVFLLAVVAVFRLWKQVGLREASPSRSWLLIWFPLLIILIFLSLAAVLGLPPAKVIFLVLVNTFFVAVSEELMTRGILLYGALTRFGIWASIIIVSAIFGAMHVFNGVITGDFANAVVQALAAAMSGFLFIALRLRTNSLLPPILVHWFWDASLFMLSGSAAASRDSGVQQSAPPLAQMIAIPLLTATPSLLYGLWLLRRIGQRDKWELISEEPTRDRLEPLGAEGL